MIAFDHILALILALPAAAAWWLWFRRGHGRVVRAVALAALVLAAAGPHVDFGRGGSDVVVVVDRSASMGEALQRQDEALRAIGEQRRGHDRLAVVAFGERALVVQAPQETGVPRLADAIAGDSGSELADGLEAGWSVLPAGRSGRVVVLSDGEFTGLEPRMAGARFALARVPIDVLPEVRSTAADAAIMDVELPTALRLGESFIGAARLLSDRDERRPWRIMRLHARGGGAEDKLVASGVAELSSLRPTIVTFADRPPAAGVAQYRVELDERDDRQPLNNRARAVLRVTGGERVLVLGGDGTPGNIATALSAAGMTVVCRAEGPVSLAELVGVSCLVLEQVPADRLGVRGLEAIAQWVEHLGGGLLMTGGRRSFGAGGYHKSAVERVLPVTMELRDEHRKLSVAMAITLDRSGSMGVTVPGGRTKMDLADEGAVAAIDLLGPTDQVAIHAVDSAPHIIVPLSPVVDKSAMKQKALGIHSEGGGIFVYQALLAAGNELVHATAGSRHILLFADANDAEEPGDYKNLLADYVKAGITVSVIGMGTDRDVDAEFLKNVAARGNGRISFAEAPEDIPRLFAQETLLVARTAWVGEPVRIQSKPPLSAELGAGLDTAISPWPTIPGYNLTYARDRASVLALCPGDPQAPALASWHIGGGRSIAACFNLDDPTSPELLAWRGYSRVVSGAVRWCAGADSDAPGALTAIRSGRTVVARLDLDPAHRERWPQSPPEVVLAEDGAIGAPRRQAMDQVDHGRWEAVFRLDDERVVIPSAVVDHVALIGPALCLPYSPEAAPRYGQTSGSAVLSELARDTSGAVRHDLVGVYDNPPSDGQATMLAPFLVAIALALLVLEVAVRRLRLGWPRLPRFAMPRWPRRGLARTPPASPPPPATAQAPRPAEATPSAPEAPPVADRKGLHDALEQLKKRRR
ncbi:MAG: VWA domain-containing protein [Planctomycetes bacterium]|nr:VWA domain-containing protein [Planctomycetota bacterium]